MPTSSHSVLMSRLIIAVVLFFSLCAPAVAGQIDPEGIKERQEESGTPDASETDEE